MHLADDPKTDAIKLMKSTHHCFSIANQYFVMEEDLFDYFHKLAEGASE